MRVLAVVAHPDDESLFAGGAMARHALDGDDVIVCALADGVGARHGDTWKDAPAQRRADAFRRACLALGANTRLSEISVTFPDQEADTVPQLTINHKVRLVICARGPDLIYTHHVGDLNLDHRRVAEAVLVATRNGPSVRCMTPEYPARCVGPAFVPTLTIALTDTTREAKVNACLCYAEELRPFPHPRSEQAIRAQASEAFLEIR